MGDCQEKMNMRAFVGSLYDGSVGQEPLVTDVKTALAITVSREGSQPSCRAEREKRSQAGSEQPDSVARNAVALCAALDSRASVPRAIILFGAPVPKGIT
jgi:hypothetical protein